MLPEKLLLKPGMKQQLLVRAHFTDGHVEDVTRWAKFTSTNEAVAQVDETGRVNVMGDGEGDHRRLVPEPERRRDDHRAVPTAGRCEAVRRSAAAKLHRRAGAREAASG